jgi:hypothetical protein
MPRPVMREAGGRHTFIKGAASGRTSQSLIGGWSDENMDEDN